MTRRLSATEGRRDAGGCFAERAMTVSPSSARVAPKAHVPRALAGSGANSRSSLHKGEVKNDA
jgi:hypothetical protein